CPQNGSTVRTAQDSAVQNDQYRDPGSGVRDPPLALAAGSWRLAPGGWRLKNAARGARFNDSGFKDSGFGISDQGLGIQWLQSSLLKTIQTLPTSSRTTCRRRGTRSS